MSVRSERIIYKERDREKERSWEEPRRTYTTIKRYQVPEGSSRSVYRDDNDYKEEKIIIKRERKEESPPPPPPLPKPREDVEYRVTERTRERGRDRSTSNIDIRFSERSRDPSRRGSTYKVIERESDWDRTPQGSRSEFRFVEKDREVIRAPSPPSPEPYREYRFERERDFAPPFRDDRPYDLERYSRSTEYFAQPQPIIIRESAPQPIIIREKRREPQRIIIRRDDPQYEFIEREEVKETALVKRDEPPPPTTVPEPDPSPSEKSAKAAPQEDYFYERRIIEKSRDRRRSGSNDRRTEIHPRDSASQYSSDDSYEYVRRERRVSGSRSHSPHHKRHLAEGALAGIAAGEIIRHHKKSQGEKAPSRGRSLVGGAALGAVGAEALSRVRSMTRRGSRSRSFDESLDHRRDRRRHRSRSHSLSRSRSRSLTRVQKLGGLAAVAAVGALAGYALKKGGNKETVVVNDRPRRSRSRRRRSSVDAYVANDGPQSALNPEHRNRRIAQVGLASAAAAGIWERVRSRSRGAKARSHSRLRQGVPIAAAGLGGAALAGLYEKNKANKEAKKEAIVREELNRGRRRRSRSRSAMAPYPNEYGPEGTDRELIAYGNEPIYPDRRGHYSDDEPGMYRRRHRGGSDTGSSPDTRGYRSRSRGARWAEGGAAAGAGAYAARDLGDRERERNDVYGAGYQQNAYAQDRGGMYSPASQAGYLPQQHTEYNNQQTYPSGNYFPPPPTGEYAHPDSTAQNVYPAYNPADYSGAGANQPDLHNGATRANETFTPDNRQANNYDVRGADRPAGRDPENVSVSSLNGVDTAQRARSASRVRLNLQSDNEDDPVTFNHAKTGAPHSSMATDRRAARVIDHGRTQRRRDDQESQSGSSPPLMHDNYEHPFGHNGSDTTEELPARFDKDGNKKPDATANPFANLASRLFSNHDR